MNQQIKQRIEQINNGQVPEGYKKTDFGVFPCDWVTIQIGDACVGNGKYGINAPACEQTGILPKYLRITDIDENGRYIDNGAFVDDKDSINYILEKNDVLFARTGASVGKSYLYNENDGVLAYAGFLIKFSINPSKCNPYLLKANCTTTTYDKWVSIMSARSGQPGINAEEYASYKFIAPKSIAEQEKIAEILMKWDKVIELQEKTIEKLHTKRDAVVQRVIKKKEGWHKEILSNILVERTEFATKEDGYPHASLTMDGVTQKTDRYNRDFLVKSDDKKYKVTHYNDICYNPANLKFGVICVNKYENDAIFSPIYITYEVNPQYNTDFIGSILCSADFIRYIRKYEEGTVYERQAVKSSDFLRGVIWVPDTKEEQDQIASIISEINTYIQKQVDYCNSLKQQRKALQQYLLNGIVRVER